MEDGSERREFNSVGRWALGAEQKQSWSSVDISQHVIMFHGQIYTRDLETVVETELSPNPRQLSQEGNTLLKVLHLSHCWRT